MLKWIWEPDKQHYILCRIWYLFVAFRNPFTSAALEGEKVWAASRSNTPYYRPPPLEALLWILPWSLHQLCKHRLERSNHFLQSPGTSLDLCWRGSLLWIIGLVILVQVTRGFWHSWEVSHEHSLFLAGNSQYCSSSIDWVSVWCSVSYTDCYTEFCFWKKVKMLKNS